MSNARRLLRFAPKGSNRAEILYCLADAASRDGNPTLLADALSKLLKDHPYSEQAARAKDAWPDPTR